MEKRRKNNRSLTLRQQAILSLRSLDPESAEFYSTVAAYFRRTSRPNRTYGLFFIFLGILSLILCVIHWRQHRFLALLVAAGYLFCGAIGLPVLHDASQTIKFLSENPESQGPETRLDQLRKVALHYPSDPVSALVLELLNLIPK